MANRVNITITTDIPAATLATVFTQSDPDASLTRMSNFLDGMKGGAASAAVTTAVNEGGATEATGTVTIDFGTAAPGDEIQINGVALVAGTDFFIGPSAEAAAINLAAAINTSVNPLIMGLVLAVPIDDTVVVHAASKGAIGNAVTTTDNSGGITFAAPRLTGGANSSTSTTSYKGFTALTRAQFNALLEQLDMDTDVNDIDYVDTFASEQNIVTTIEFRALLTKLDLDNGVQDNDYSSIT